GFCRSIVLSERIAGDAEAFAADLLVHRSARLAPLIDGTIETEAFDGLDGAVEGHPRHHLGMDEVAARPSHFPDAFVRLRPGVVEKGHQRPFERPGGLVDGNAAAPTQMERIDQLPVHIELKLMDGGVADAYRLRIGESR